MTFAGGIINFDTRLMIVNIYIKFYTGAVVFNGQSFHLNARSDEVFPFKDGRHAIEHVTVRFLDVVGDHILKGQHALHVEITCR